MRDGELSLKKAKEEQYKLWDLIYKMKIKTERKSLEVDIIDLIAAAENFYKIRNKVTNVFEKKNS